MSLLLKNLQTRISFNQHLLKMQCHFLMAAFGVPSFDMSVICLSSSQQRYLNKIFRQVDEVTDILSFPFHENLLPGTIPSPTNIDDYNLGDITLGLPYIHNHCREDNISIEHHLPVLLTHGICHLLGYDHNSPAAAKQMYMKEMSILAQFNNSFGTNIKPLTTFE